MARCNLCGREVKDVADHIRKVHMGKLSEQSYEYLKSLGIENLEERLAELGLNWGSGDEEAAEFLESR